jgi:hypothetical protein
MSDFGGKRDVKGTVWYYPGVVIPPSAETFQKVHRSGAVGIRLIRVPPEFMEMLQKAPGEREKP